MGMTHAEMAGLLCQQDEVIAGQAEELERLREIAAEYEAWRAGRIGVEEHFALAEENRRLRAELKRARLAHYRQMHEAALLSVVQSGEDLDAAIEARAELVRRWQADTCPKCGCHRASGSMCPPEKQPCPFDGGRGNG